MFEDGKLKNLENPTNKFSKMKLLRFHQKHCTKLSQLQKLKKDLLDYCLLKSDTSENKLNLSAYINVT